MSIYCEFEGIPGNVTAAGYENQIDISSLNFNVKRKISMIPGHAANRESTRPEFEKIVLTKGFDVATPSFFKGSVSISEGKKVILHFVRTHSNALQEFMTYELFDCLISGFEIFADGGDGGPPREEVTLAYSKLNISYTQFDKTNTAGSPVRQGYDLTTAKPV